MLKNDFKSLELSIILIINQKRNDLIIQKENIVDMEITHTIMEPFKTGYLNIEDRLQYNLMLNNYPYTKLYFNAIDMYGASYKEFFIVTNIHLMKNEKGDTLRIEFIDEITWNMLNYYKSKGYVNTYFKQIFQEYYNNINTISLIPKPLHTAGNNFKEGVLYSNVVIPNNLSFMKYFFTKQHMHGLIFYVNRNNSFLIDIAKLTTMSLDATGTHVYSFPKKDSEIDKMNPFTIYEINISKAKRLDMNLKFPNSYISWFDSASKTPHVNVVSTNSFYSNISAKPSVPVDTLGERQSYLGKIHQSSNVKSTAQPIQYVHDMIKNTLNNTTINILTHGGFINDIGLLVQIAVPVGADNQGYDKSLSGTYLVTDIIDKYSFSKGFYQKITLMRYSTN